jgi:hypothetical protein
MRKHLYHLKNNCPASAQDLVLTIEIKENVLKNRVYIPPPVIALPVQPPTINTTINNHLIINNYVANMDPFTKLERLTRYKGTEILDFNSHVEEKYEKQAERFKNDSFRGNEAVKYDRAQLLELVHSVTRSEKRNLEDTCVLYIKDENRVYISEGRGEWDDQHRDNGVCKIIDTIAAYCLEYYEQYLIRKLEGGKITFNERSAIQNCIEEYYRFISVFDVRPFVQGKSDAEVMFNEDDEQYNDTALFTDIDSHRIVDKFNALYLRIKQGLSDSQKKASMNTVFEVIKSSTKTNIRDLNKRIVGSIMMDETFKKSILTTI